MRMNDLNAFVLPAPGSIVSNICGPVDRKLHQLFMVIAAKEVDYPGPWRQYFLTLMGSERIITFDVECSDFHYNWHVLHRP